MDLSEISSMSERDSSDIDTDDLQDTPDTSDMKFSDDDSILNISSSSDSVSLLSFCIVLLFWIDKM